MYGRETSVSKLLLTGLSGVAALYGTGVRFRKIAYRKGWLHMEKLPCYVISIGNITLGGTGKTPMAIYLAELIHSSGYRVAIVSRGYGGSAESEGGVVSDGKHVFMPASACGDEPLMMARTLKNIPVLVGRNRYRTGREALKRFSPDVILLDDAFQHIQLERDLDLVLLDAEKPIGNGRMFPRGVLREKKEGLQRSSAVVLTRAGERSGPAMKTISSYLQTKPIFRCDHQAYIAAVISEKAKTGATRALTEGKPGMDVLKECRGDVFSAIADNQRFRRTMEQTGCWICGSAFFQDHHRYSRTDLETIMDAARNSNAELMVTTEKDYARISDAVTWPMDLVVVGVKIHFADNSFDRYIGQNLAQADIDPSIPG